MSSSSLCRLLSALPKCHWEKPRGKTVGECQQIVWESKQFSFYIANCWAARDCQGENYCSYMPGMLHSKIALNAAQHLVEHLIQTFSKKDKILKNVFGSCVDLCRLWQWQLGLAPATLRAAIENTWLYSSCGIKMCQCHFQKGLHSCPHNFWLIRILNCLQAKGSI